MKKLLLSLSIIFSGILMSSFLFAAEEADKATFIVHYQNWESDYTNIGAHAWGGTAGAMAKPTGKDDFGIFFKYENMPVQGELGFIAVKFTDTENNSSQDWDNGKQTGDVKIKLDDFAKDQTHHIYVFQGAATSATNPAYYAAKNDKYNLLLVYADPANKYEENLGVHMWNSDADPKWGEPAKVFTKGGSHSAISEIKVAMISSSNADLGMLIYAGGDENKKTGDVTFKNAIGEETTAALGQVGVAYVYSKGDAYTKNDNVVYSLAEFTQEAFSFKLLPMGRDNQGLLTGTYAPRPNQVFVETSSNVANPVKDAVDKEAATKEVASWFTVKDSAGAVVKIKEVQFNAAAETLNKFVIILDANLDNTKEYVVTFDLKLTTDANKKASLAIDLDKEAPVISFVSPSEIVGEEEGDRIIIVEWNKKFDQNKFPGFISTDDRDGDLTKLVFVPKGEFSKINTNVLGDYKIVLRVEDTWGNVTEETFIFRVQKVK